MHSYSEKNRYFITTVTALVAVAVLTLSWPRLQASYRYLPVEFAIQRYFTTLVIPSDRLPVLIRFAGRAVELHDHYRYHDGLSLLHLLRAMDVKTPALDRIDAYRASEAEALEALESAPAQPDIWLRLAVIRWILHDEPETILTPWKMSIFTGRRDFTLFAQRLEIGLAHHDFLDAEGKALLSDQMLLAWGLQPGSVMRVLAQRDRGLLITRKLIGNTDPTAQAEMEAWLEKLR